MTRAEALKIAKPILFNTEMVRAILDGRKTVTRRVAKNLLGISECDHEGEHEFILDNFAGRTNPTGFVCRKCGRGVSPPHSRRGVGNSWIVPPCFPDDVLYIRETWFYEEHMHDKTAEKPDLPSGRYSFRYIYKASEPDYPVDVGVSANGWCPSIHMPKEAARIFLRVTGVSVERLRDITVEQAWKEGCENPIRFDRLWNSTIKKSDLKKYGWGANPWVWVIEFERLEVE